MENKLNETVKNYYDELVPKTANYGSARWKSGRAKISYQQTFEALEKNLTKYCAKESDVLEVGPGSAVWTPLIISLLNPKKIVLSDISKAMLTQAKLNLSKLKSRNIEYRLGDFQEYNPKDKFDLIIFTRSFEYFPEKPRSIKKASQMLKDGGILMVLTKNPYFLPKKIANVKLLQGRLKKLLPLGLNKLVATYQSPIQQDWIKARQLKQLIEKNGLALVRCSPVVRTFSSNPKKWQSVISRNTSSNHLDFSQHSNSFLSLTTESYLLIARRKQI